MEKNVDLYKKGLAKKRVTRLKFVCTCFGILFFAFGNSPKAQAALENRQENFSGVAVVENVARCLESDVTVPGSFKQTQGGQQQENSDAAKLKSQLSNMVCVLSDYDNNNNDKKMWKKIKIYNIPHELDFSYIRIYPVGCSQSTSGVIFNAEDLDAKPSGAELEMVSRKGTDAKGEYAEFCFIPNFDDKAVKICTGEKVERKSTISSSDVGVDRKTHNFGCMDSGFDLVDFAVDVHLKDKANNFGGVSFIVSNAGLKKPKILQEVKNVSVDVVSKNGANYWKVSGISNVGKSIGLDYDKVLPNSDGKYDKPSERVELSLENDGCFYAPCPISLDDWKKGLYSASLYFNDSEGAGYALFSFVGNYENLEKAKNIHSKSRQDEEHAKKLSHMQQDVWNGCRTSSSSDGESKFVNGVAASDSSTINFKNIAYIDKNSQEAKECLDWQKNVWVELSDCAPGQKYMKKLTIHNIPDYVNLGGVSVCPEGTPVHAGRLLIDSEEWQKELQNKVVNDDCSTLVKRSDENGTFYECYFNPYLGDKFGKCESFNCDRFNNLSEFKVGLPCKPVDSNDKSNYNFGLKVSNEGLKRPAGLDSFKKYGVKLVGKLKDDKKRKLNDNDNNKEKDLKTYLEEGYTLEDFQVNLRIEGFPENVEKVVFEDAAFNVGPKEPDITDKNLINFEVECKNGVIEVPYDMLKGKNGRHVYALSFRDPDNFCYWIMNSFWVKDGTVFKLKDSD